MNLFQWGKFTSHSGKDLDWKIECDALTDEDIDCLAKVLCLRFNYSTVIGVPTGGLLLASAMNKYMQAPHEDIILIVDDVLTTGQSMEKLRHQISAEKNIHPDDIRGVVIFARTRCPWWVTPLFQLDRAWE